MRRFISIVLCMTILMSATLFSSSEEVNHQATEFTVGSYFFDENGEKIYVDFSQAINDNVNYNRISSDTSLNNVSAFEKPYMPQSNTRNSGIDFERLTNFNTIVSPNITTSVKEPKYSYESFMNENISEYSGELTLNFDDLVLEGRNGLDLKIGRTYQSVSADVGEPVMMIQPYGEYLVTRTTTDYSNYLNDRYNLGTGWSFNFPSVQVVKEFVPQSVVDTYYYEIYEELYYHTGTGEVYHVKFTEDTTDSNLEDYYRKDVVFSRNDTSYTNGQVTSYYSFSSADGTKQYFSEDGRLIGIKDRFGNTIKFEHTMMPVSNYVPDGSFGYENTVWSISDTESIVWVDEIINEITGSDDTVTCGLMEFTAASDTGDFIISQPIMVEPFEEYNFSVALKSLTEQCTDDIEVSLIGYDAVYNTKNMSATEFNIEDILYRDWSVHSCDFTISNSAVRYVQIMIKLSSETSGLYVDDVKFDKKKPLISKITDSIGRTVEFEYTGNLNDNNGAVLLTVKTPDNSNSKIMTYNKSTIKYHMSYFNLWEERKYWYLTSSDTQGTNGYPVYYYYNGGINEDGLAERLYFDYYAKTHSYEDSYKTKPLLGMIQYKDRLKVYEYESVRKHFGTDGYYDTMRITSRYEHDGYIDSVVVDGKTDYYIDYLYDNKLNKAEYSYSGVCGETIFDNETGYPDLFLADNENSGEQWICEKISTAKNKTFFTNSLITKKTTEDLAETIKTTDIYTNSLEFKNQPEYIERTISKNNEEKTLYKTILYNEYGLVAEESDFINERDYRSVLNRHKYLTCYSYSEPYLFLSGKNYYKDLDKRSLSVTNTYDSLGRLVESINEKGEKTTYLYENIQYPGNVTKVLQNDPANMNGLFSSQKNVSYTYDNYGLYVSEETEIIDGQERVTEYIYEYIYGNLKLKIYPDDSYEQYVYYDDGRLYQSVSPYIQNVNERFRILTQYSYLLDSIPGYYSCLYAGEVVYKDSGALVEGENTASLFSTEAEYYNAVGNLCATRKLDLSDIQVADAHTLSITNLGTNYYYDAFDRLICEKDSENNAKNYSYDCFGRVINFNDKDGNIHKYSYDDIENELEYYILTSDNSSKNYLKKTYDDYGNMIVLSVYPNGRENAPVSEYYEYDLNGNCVKFTDGNGNITSYAYDELNNLKETTLPNGVKASALYSKMGLPSSERIKDITGKEKHSRISYYNEDGTIKNRFYNYNNRLRDISTYEYDENGRLTYSDEYGYTNSYSYDDYGNLISKSNGTSLINRRYGQFGENIAFSSDSSVTGIVYLYDDVGRISCKGQEKYGNDNIIYNILYGYSALDLDELISFENVSGREETYEYTNSDKLKKITTAEKEINYEYTESGYVSKITYPNGMTTEYQYDNANRVVGMITKLNDTVINNLAYTYDNNSNVISEARNNVTTTYSYDSLDRLKTVVYNDKTVSYEYDTSGNRTKEITVTDNDTEVKEYIYNDRYQLIKIKTDGIITDAYTYNEKGAVKTHNNKAYTYDVWNKLSSVTENGITHTFKYDVNGIRTQKDNIQYIVDRSNNVVAEVGEDDSLLAETVWGHQPLARKTNGSWYYYIYNAHGDVIGLVSDSGEVVNAYQYDAWGNIISETETIDNPIKYAGEYYDDELSMYYLRARYYNPSIGRFTSYDIEEGNISNPQDMNRYVYCRNNPIKYVDPSGRIAEWVIVALYTYAQAVVTSPDLQYDMQMLAYDISNGDYVSAAFDLVDILSPGISGSKMVPKFIRKYFDELAGWIKNIGKNVDDLPSGWTKTTHGEFTHIRDTEGRIRVRIDPPDKKTPYSHKHIYDIYGNSLDINGNVVNPKSPEAHIPLN